MNSVRLVSENGVSNIQKKLWYVDDSSEINLDNFEAGDRIYSINDNKLFQIEYDTSNEQEYSGEIVSFEADEDDRISSLEVEINPIQDLHGYDSPWPAGGGVNLFDKDAIIVGKWLNVNTGAIENASNAYCISDYIPVKANTTYTFSDNQSSRCWFYDADKQPVSIITNRTFTPTADGYALITISTVSVDINTVMFVAGSTLPSIYSPYSNECPISGWTGAEIEQTGKNLFGGTIVNGFCPINSYIKSGIKYWVLGDIVTQTATYLQIRQAEKGTTPTAENTTNVGSVISGTLVVARNFTPDLARYDYYLYAVVYTNLKNVQLTLFKPTQETYHPYTGNQISVTFPDEAGTVYGATMTLNPDKTGALVMDRETYTFNGTENYRDFTTVITCVTGLPKGLTVAGNDIICSHAVVGAIHFSNSSKVTVQFDKNYFGVTNVEELKDFLANQVSQGTPVQYSYKLDSPQTIPLTAAEVSGILSTLYGTNNVWADTGEINVKVIKNDITAFELKPYN